MTQASRGPPGCMFVFFLLMGLIGTAVFGYLMIWLPLRVNLFYVETTCVVLDKRLEEKQDDDGPTSRPLIFIEYTAVGRARQAWTYDATGIFSNLHNANRAVLQRFEKGQRCPCWYDPANPDSAVLTRSFGWASLMVLIPVTFAVVGAGGLIHNRRSRKVAPAVPVLPAPGFRELRPAIGFVVLFIGGFFAAGAVSLFLMFNFAGFGTPVWQKAVLFFAPFIAYATLMGVVGRRFLAQFRRSLPSPERAARSLQARAAEADRDDLAPVEAAEEEENAWPTIPTLAPLGQGRELTYRLASNSRPGRFVLVALGVAVFWNGIVSIFLGQLIQGYLQGRPDWCLTMFLIPFVLIGLVLLAGVLLALVSFLGSLLAGSLDVEIAAHPLRPGSSCEFLARQVGPCRLRCARLTLKCSESATYTAGTNTVTATKEVYRADIAGPVPSLDGGVRGTLTVPPDAMHSFEANHNKITWHLEVHGWLLGLLPHGSEFPVIVLPSTGGART